MGVAPSKVAAGRGGAEASVSGMAPLGDERVETLQGRGPRPRSDEYAARRAVHKELEALRNDIRHPKKSTERDRAR